MIPGNIAIMLQCESKVTATEKRVSTGFFPKFPESQTVLFCTDFSIEIISNAFENRTTIQRHRMVYAALSEEFGQGLHALSLNTKTDTEAQRLQMTYDT